MRKLFFAVALALVSLASTAQTSMKINMDPSVKPGDDFWQYAVGGWLKANPLDAQHPENGAFTDLYELNNDRINKLIMAYAEKKDLPQGSDGQKIGALYRLYMDSVSRNRMGYEPIMQVNGQKTLGENVCDNGGLKIAYRAYKNRKASEPLGDVDGFTPDQRFYLAYARVWACNSTPE